MVANKAFNIGEGKKLSRQNLKKIGAAVETTGVVTVLPFTKPEREVGALKKERQSCKSQNNPKRQLACTREESEQFACPDESCIKIYSSVKNLQRHLDYGKHEMKLHEESQFDSIRRKWAEKCTSVKTRLPPRPSADFEPNYCTQRNIEVSERRGWALRQTKCHKRYSAKVKNYLLELFLIGEETGRKVTPTEASRRMRRAQNESTGGRLFLKEDWLTAHQVSSYFSRLSSLKRAGRLPARLEPDDGDYEEDEAAIMEVNRERLQQAVFRELTL